MFSFFFLLFALAIEPLWTSWPLTNNIMIILHFHLLPQFKYELFHICFTSTSFPYPSWLITTFICIYRFLKNDFGQFLGFHVGPRNSGKISHFLGNFFFIFCDSGASAVISDKSTMETILCNQGRSKKKKLWLRQYPWTDYDLGNGHG